MARTAALPSLSAGLPRRDPVARATLADVARRSRPVSHASERVVPVAGPLGELLPGGGLRRGSVVTVEGDPGAGATSVALTLAAAATAIGEWAAVVDLDASLGGRAAAEAGVALDRFAVVRRVPPDRWATAVAVLLDGMSLVVAEMPRSVRGADARRLAARARERDAVLVPLGTSWPAEATLRVRAAGGSWSGFGTGSGRLAERTVWVYVEGRGAAARVRADELVLAG